LDGVGFVLQADGVELALYWRVGCAGESMLRLRHVIWRWMASFGCFQNEKAPGFFELGGLWSGEGLGFVGTLNVCFEEVLAPVVFEVAPHGVDVVGSVLRAVVFDQEFRGCDAVIVGATFGSYTGPGEVGLVDEAGVLGSAGRCQFFREVVGVLFDEGFQDFLLFGVELGGGESVGLAFEGGDAVG